MINPAVASACICKPPDNPLEQSKATFFGTVIGIKEYNRWDDRYEVTLEVKQVWKGSLGNEVTVLTDDHSMWCGQRLILGSDYLVYAKNTDNQSIPETIARKLKNQEVNTKNHGLLETNTCSTIEMPQALLHIVILNSKVLGLLFIMAVTIALYLNMTWKK